MRMFGNLNTAGR